MKILKVYVESLSCGSNQNTATRKRSTWKS